MADLYATETDLDNKFGAVQITLLADCDNDGERDTDPGTGEGVVTVALRTATRIINSRIGQRLPQVLAPEDFEALRDYACHLARYELYSDVVPEHVQRRRDDAIADLNRIADGRMQFGRSDGTQPSVAPAESSIQMTSQPGRGWDSGVF